MDGTNKSAKNNKKNKNKNMMMVTAEKSKLGELNDKRYVFPDGISSLPYRHKDLISVAESKNNLNLRPQDLIKNHENDMLKYEQKILQENEKMRIINSIMTQQLIFYKKGDSKDDAISVKSHYQ